MSKYTKGVNKKTYTAAIAGNPNTGKSTLVNAIAGSRLTVGNWSGVTVEKKEADITIGDGVDIKLVDLPGTYSLSPYSEEEIVARDFLVDQRPDVIINVIDATNLERNLFLTIQLLELEIPTIIALNMFDEVEDRGFTIDIKKLEDILGVLAVPTAASKKKGIDDLLKATAEVVKNLDRHQPRRRHYGKDIEEALQAVASEIQKNDPELLKRYPLRWLSGKIIERDASILEKIKIDAEQYLEHKAIHHLEMDHDGDLESIISEARHAKTAGLAQEALKKPSIPKFQLTEIIDQFVLNRFLGLPFFLLTMWLMFKFTFDISTPFVDWIDIVISGPLTRWSVAFLNYLGASDWLVSLVTEAIIGGVGFLLAFVPVIFCLMLGVTFLEGCGYMARAAFIMDRYMHFLGLHGKSFIPMIISFGCNVPGVYATRALETYKDKALTALLLPLMSCGARLPVYALFIGVFFKNNGGAIIFSLYVLGILLAIFMGVIFRRTFFRGETPVFIMELPPYRLPSMRNLLVHTWEKAKHFIIKAVTFILAISILIWFALNLPWGVENKKDSYLGRSAVFITPIFEPLGFGRWEAAASILTGLAAKEVIISTMGEILSAEKSQSHDDEKTSVPSFKEDLLEIVVSFGAALKQSALNAFGLGIAGMTIEAQGDSALRANVKKYFTPLSAYSFMVFALLYVPCLVTGFAMRQEFGSWNLYGVSVVYSACLAWISAFIVFQAGSFLGIGV